MRVVRCTLYVVRYTLLVTRCMLLVAHCTLRVVRCSLRIVSCTLRIVRCTLYATHCALYVARCTLYVVRCTLYRFSWKLYLFGAGIVMDNITVWEDYYGILQVHYRAEPEIICTAYKRLSKRYHPDINRGRYAEEMMKKINIAYDTLIDEKKRAEYNREWNRRNEKGRYSQSFAGAFRSRPNTRNEDACEQIERYFRMISLGDYKAAYQCISKADKGNIKVSDFLRWQTAVGKVVELGDVRAEIFKVFANKQLGKKKYNEVIEFSVQLREKDLRKNSYKEYTTLRSMVFEDGCWRIYLGYTSVKPLIAKFEEGRELNVDVDAAIDSWLTLKSKQDSLTMLPNISGFTELAAKEVTRSKRYNNTFSLLAFEAVHKGGVEKDPSKNESIAVLASDVLRGGLRDTDILCRWNDTKFIALLTETDITAANRAANRICRAFNREALKINKRDDYYAIYAGVCQFDFVSIESTIKKCGANLAFAKKSGRVKAVTGIYSRLRGFRFARRIAMN